MNSNQSQIAHPKPVLSEVEVSPTPNRTSHIPNPKSKFGWLILTAVIFIPRLLNLNVFLTADEPLFLQHAREFAAGLASGDFSQTLGIGYPGVTVAAWAAPVINLAQSEMAQSQMGAYAAGRAATGLLTGVLLLVLFGLARTLVGRRPALIGVILLALDPYTLGYSRLLHIAAPLALLMTLAGVAFLLWLRDSRWQWLLLTGLFSGLALLTKSTALLLAPMLVIVLITWGVSTGQWKEKKWWLWNIGCLLAISFIGAIVFFVLWPAMWVNPMDTLNLTFGKLLVDQEAGAGNLGLFWLGKFVEDPGPAFYPVAFILKATPWLLLGLLLSMAWLINATRNTQHVHQLPIPVLNKVEGTNYQLPITLALWLFALTYLIFMTIASKKSIRYMLPAFPTFYLLAGLAYYQTAYFLKSSQILPRLLFFTNNQVPITLGLLLSLLLFTFFYHPYYLTYYNPLVLGWRWAPHTLLVGWGEGLDGAARYLNQQPPGRTSAWYEWLFPVLYNGDVQPVVPQENLITADKSVLYINQVQRDIPGPNIIHYFQTRRQPEYTTRLAGIDYAWVYPGPIAGFQTDPQPQHPTGGEFGGEARLLGYDLHPLPAKGGQSLFVTLYWQALVTPPAERFVFLRLVDAQGHVWAKSDSPPVMGLWPAPNWQPDMFIEDAHELSIPPGTPPGAYHLEVGMYEPTNPPRNLTPLGQPIGPGGGLMLDDVNIEWQPLRVEPDLPWYTNAKLAPNARLMGYTTPLTAAATGDIIPVSLAWREAASLFSRWLDVPNDYVMFEWRQNGQRIAEHLDPLPLPIDQWGHGALLRSQHNLIVPPTLHTGQYDVVVMLHTGSDPAGDAYPLATVDVTAPPHHFELPTGVATPSHFIQLAGEANQIITLPGYELSTSGQGVDAALYWQTDAPLTTGYKVFAQLLNSNNEVVAQSDAVPGGGVRPTTGWLPGEVIADRHKVYASDELPAGTYRLIVGFYNPANGQRLAVLNEAEEVIGDAVTLTEVTLP